MNCFFYYLNTLFCGENKKILIEDDIDNISFDII